MKKEPIVIYLNRTKHIVRNPATKRPARKPIIDKPPRKAKQEPRSRGGKGQGPPADRNIPDPETIRGVWTTTFGHRLKIDDEKGFLLDGRPINLDELMVETNRLRREAGLPLVGKKSEWLT